MKQYDISMKAAQIIGLNCKIEHNVCLLVGENLKKFDINESNEDCERFCNQAGVSISEVDGFYTASLGNKSYKDERKSDAVSHLVVML